MQNVGVDFVKTVTILCRCVTKTLLPILYVCFYHKLFAYTTNNDSFWQICRSLIKAQVSNRKVAGSMPVLGINANTLKAFCVFFYFLNFSFACFKSLLFFNFYSYGASSLDFVSSKKLLK